MPTRSSRPVTHTDDLVDDLVRWMGKLAATLTTERGSAMLRILTVACMEHEDTAIRLRAGFSSPLLESVRERLLADGVDESTATSAADAIVGAVVYPIQSEGRAYGRKRAESTTRLIIAGLAVTAAND